MDVSTVVVGVCKRCESNVPAGAVSNVVTTGQGRRFFFSCPNCQVKDTVFWTSAQLEGLKKKVQAQGAAEMSQAIGNMVYGFKQDLDAFTVEDIIEGWEYEERYSFDSIPQETEVRVWLR